VSPVLFGILVAVLVPLALWWNWRQAEKRADAYRVWAAEHGWRYRKDRDRKLAKRYAFLDRLRAGSNRYAYDHAEGDWEGRPAQSFNFHYQTGSGKNTQHHYLSVVMLGLEREFPELRIHPENFFHRIGQAIGLGDIDFESVEFSRAFVVRGEDKKFAYDFCHTRMMEHLLRHRSTALEIEGQWMATFVRGRLEADGLAARLDELLTLRGLMPDFLFRD
jgi:hypothetical protein